MRKAKEFIKQKKKEWARSVYNNTLRKVALNEFPESFKAQSIKMHKSNEKMYPMLETVEKVIVTSILANMQSIGTAIHKI